MPSWVHNRIYIRGDATARQEITDANFDFEILLPCPDDKNSDEWAREQYGTFQEGPARIKHEDYRDQICVVISTGWCPPIKFCRWLVNHYKHIWIKIFWEDESFEGGVILIERTREGELNESGLNRRINR
jgi:hypothetical protein